MGKREAAADIFVPEGADGETHLLVSRCACGALAFPPRERCAACGNPVATVEEAPTNGIIFSWTTQPGSQPPRVVALVRLENGMVVQGFVDASVDSVTIDLPVRTIAVPFRPDDEESPLSYAFAPAVEARS